MSNRYLMKFVTEDVSVFDIWLNSAVFRRNCFMAG
jgi:hypothetical protein